MKARFHLARSDLRGEGISGLLECELTWTTTDDWSEVSMAELDENITWV